jgi:glycine/D-amino acid oxidase-like deaminating enzyme
MLSFTDWAISQTVATMVELGIQDKCGYSNNGSLALRFKSGPSSSPSSSEKKSKLSFETTLNLNSADEVVKVEPYLKSISDRLSGALNETKSSMGDSHVFVESLADECKRLGFAFHCGTAVDGMRVDGNKVTGVCTNRGEVRLESRDKLVVAAGSWTPRILWHAAGLFVPVYLSKDS